MAAWASASFGDLSRSLTVFMLAFAAIFGQVAKAEVPANLWPRSTAVAPAHKLIFFKVEKDQDSSLRIEIQHLPSATTPAGGLVAGLDVASEAWLATNLRLNQKALDQELRGGGSHKAEAAAAQILFGLSEANLVLASSYGGDPSVWSLWRQNANGGADIIYSGPHGEATAQDTAAFEAEITTFLRRALGYDAELVAASGGEYLVHLLGDQSPTAQSMAFGLSSSASQLRIANAEERPGLGLLRLKRAAGPWAVYQLVSAKTTTPWPIGTKLLLQDYSHAPAQ